MFEPGSAIVYGSRSGCPDFAASSRCFAKRFDGVKEGFSLCVTDSASTAEAYADAGVKVIPYTAAKPAVAPKPAPLLDPVDDDA